MLEIFISTLHVKIWSSDSVFFFFFFFLLPKHILLPPAKTVFLGSHRGQWEALKYAFKAAWSRQGMEIGPRFVWVWIPVLLPVSWVNTCSQSYTNIPDAHWFHCLWSEFNNFMYVKLGFPRGGRGTESSFQCRRCKRLRFSPWAEKIPWRRK